MLDLVSGSESVRVRILRTYMYLLDVVRSRQQLCTLHMFTSIENVRYRHVE